MICTEIIRTIRNIDKRAQEIEKIANAREKEGWSLLSAVSTPNFGIILIFRTPEEEQAK